MKESLVEVIHVLKIAANKSGAQIHIPWNKKGELGLENPAIARQRQAD